MVHPLSCIAGLLVAAVVLPSQAAPVAGFTETVLASSATDPDLVNPWGIALSGTGPFWVSDNGSGKSTLYNSAGTKLGLVVSMPAGSEPVTGQVFNGTSSFNGDTFLFATEAGTITGWRGALGTTAEALFTVAGANYKGLAISDDKRTLYAANFAAGTIDIFTALGQSGAVSDPALPSGYAPFNVQNLGGKLVVTYALRNGQDDVAGAGHGFVKVFDPATQTFSALVSQGSLNSPWGLAIAPIGFGSLAGDLLVGNFGDGLINAFDLVTGSLVGTVADTRGQALRNDGLWGLSVGNGGSGGLRSALYLTAGPADETGGLFARIEAVATPGVPEPGGLALAGVALLGLIGAGGTRPARPASPARPTR